MIGSGTNTIGAQGRVQGGISTQVAGNASNLTSQVQAGASSEGGLGQAPYWFIGLAVLYVVWAFVIQHERVKESLQPANIAANFHNFFVVSIAAVLGIVGGKILLTKAVAWGIPGAAQLAQVWMAA